MNDLEALRAREAEKRQEKKRQEKLEKQLKAMVERFQCPGCVAGGDATCGRFLLSARARPWDRDHRDALLAGARNEVPEPGMCCAGHVPGTHLGLGNLVRLGFPKGYNKVSEARAAVVRLWPRGTSPLWDRLNVPVWAAEKKGYLFVRTYAPRVDRSFVDVVAGGVLADLRPRPLDSSKFERTFD